MADPASIKENFSVDIFTLKRVKLEPSPAGTKGTSQPDDFFWL